MISEDTKFFVKLARRFLFNHKQKYNAKEVQLKLIDSGYPDVPSLKSIYFIVKNDKLDKANQGKSK